jgi:hypothetical protein
MISTYRDETIARPLREEADSQNDEESQLVSTSLEKGEI